MNKYGTHKRTCHVSIDDVTFALQRLTNRDYASIYEDKLFRYLCWMHRLFGLTVTLYAYAQYGEWSLDDMPDKYKREFEDAEEWMKFGFHAVSDEQKDNNIIPEFAKVYKDTLGNIERFAGVSSIAKIVRLHYWYYPNEYLDVLKWHGVKAVLVKSEEKVMFPQSWSTTIQIEKCSIIDIIKQTWHYREVQPMVVFTHEWALNRKNKIKLAMAIMMIRMRGYNYICE